MATQGRGEEAYRRLLSEDRARGWSVREIARRSGVPYWTLIGWSRRLRKREDLPLPAVLPVTVVDAASQPVVDHDDEESCVSAVLHLRGGRRLVLPPTLSTEDLARLVRALESPGC